MRAAIPDLAFGTDIIVGFPGETEDDFRETLEVVEEVGFDSAFTFVYSPRAGTEAAAMAGPGPARGEDRAHGAARRADAAARPRCATRRASAASSRCSSRARRAPIRRCCAAARAGTRRSTSPAPPQPGELVDVARRGSDLDHAARRPGGPRRCLTGPSHPSVRLRRDADPRHRLVRPDRHEPRAAPPRGRPRGLRRRQAPEPLGRATLPDAAPGPRRPLLGVPRRHQRRRVPRGRPRRPSRRAREGAPARAPAAPRARERDHDLQRPRVRARR